MKSVQRAQPAKDVLRCLCCKAEKTIDRLPGASVGTISKASGYFPILMKDTTVRWACSSCMEEKLLPHVRALVELLGDPMVFWDGLPHHLKKEGNTL